MRREPRDWKAYLDCDCGTKAHMIVLEYDEYFGMQISVQARQWRGFWKRVWVALKYVFAGRTLEWDGSLIQKKDIEKVEAWLNQVKEHGPGTMYDSM